MDFENLNETGSISSAIEDDGLFLFQYANDFYGSGTFAGRILEIQNRPLELDLEDFRLRDYHLRRGNLEGLSQSARAFFGRELRRYRSLIELRGNLLRFDDPSTSRPPFLNFFRWRSVIGGT